MQTPLNPLQLSAFLHQHLNLSVASHALIEGHQAPFEYLVHAFFQGRGGFGEFGLARPAPALDSVVWASRGGGKTFLGAVATALDLMFKPGIEIRILGGSLDQSRRMHAHLRRLFAKEPLADMIEGRIGESRLALKNGSVVELLAQSHTAVRGTRVQTLRCDEAELFKEDVFDAAMLTTMSKTVNIPGVGPTEIAGSIECMSTMHVPFGLMSRLVKDNARRVFKWGVVDVLAECGERHVCAECVLWTECRGKAKEKGAKGRRDKGAEGKEESKVPRGSMESEVGVRTTDVGLQRQKESPRLDVRARNEVKGTEGERDALGAEGKTETPSVIARGLAMTPPPLGKGEEKGGGTDAREGSCASGTTSASEDLRLDVRARNEVKGAGAKGAAKRVKRACDRGKESSEFGLTGAGLPGVAGAFGATAPFTSLRARGVSVVNTESVRRVPGHMPIDDAIRMKRRVSLPMWNTEMLCLEPSRADTVFPEFDPKKHVFRDWEDEDLFRFASESDRVHTRQVDAREIGSDSNPHPAPSRGEGVSEKGSARGLPLAFADIDAQAASLLLAKREVERKKCGELWVCGIDFGFRAPTVILWGAVEAHTRVLRILDERILERATTREHVEAIFKGNGRGWKLPDFVGVDPAGKQVNGQTGVRDADVFRESGLDVHTRSLGIGSGLHLIRARLAPAEGPVRLFVHVRCRGLIEALTKYHYRVDRPEDLEPVKDGSDHAVDALRYMVLNLDLRSRVRSERYAG